jgi:hypothetical protein
MQPALRQTETVVERQLDPRRNIRVRHNPDAIAHDFGAAVGRAGMVDQLGEIEGACCLRPAREQRMRTAATSHWIRAIEMASVP